MPMKKPPGHYDISSEMIVAAGDVGITEITKLANMFVSLTTVRRLIR